MVRENSFSDSDGRSLTPDLSEEEDNGFVAPSSPTAEHTTNPSANNNNNGSRTRVDTFPSTNVQPTTSGIASDPGPAITKSGLPPSTSPSVLFKEPESINYDARSKLTHSSSAPPGPIRSNTTTSKPARDWTPADRFRAAVQKVIRMHRGSTALSLGGAGAEPGIDPRRASAYLNYGHIRQKCTIELVDYSSVRASFGKMENRGFTEFLMDPRASARESWVKVRWINVGGVSWDVISSLAIKYDIHPLALEDVLHMRGTQARSKADYYLKHLFIRILRHTPALDDEEDDKNARETIAPPTITRLPRSSSPDMMSKHGDSYESDSGEWSEDVTLAGSKSLPKRVGSMRKAHAVVDIEQGKHEPARGRTMSSLTRRRRVAETMTIEQLKRGERVNVDVIPFFIFLFRDGTVISINQSPDIDFTGPITARLRQRDTGLRATADPSLLVQSLLDLVVDQALEVVDKYQDKILKLEHDILIKPKMKTVRYLHILSGDLTLHKRTLEPIKTLVYGLRRYDVDRCAALINASNEGSNAATPTKIEGFMSHKSKIYLADVHDHIDYIINSLDMFSSISENLINYTFNMASYEMNEVMRRLTMATIIFLPLTLLTGYFGMNFDPMWSVQQNSDALFWKIAIPVMVVVIPLFTWPDIQRMIHFVEKRWAARNFEKAVKRSTVHAKKTQ
ncbi:uncharacterized protein FOMMEDRAFT_149129 [Fomitiporia mediterranea MF3/22]|uniref:uncharacterized protein n=1 Tax=Fomitiporia mediterranea (strain MF3/22) TaxID=694068 RepID=UPI0004409A94|nr:uncharacterized protein FOMMEDRAFT_149129 [Fomitiporia mediterranea MF3/22]EJC98797.1 hypothetical protein FOMMEDRAFT_149129 [Fomitiporia mediterranea MF3/22]